jgi:hypothetical protein
VLWENPLRGLRFPESPESRRILLLIGILLVWILISLVGYVMLQCSIVRCNIARPRAPGELALRVGYDSVAMPLRTNQLSQPLGFSATPLFGRLGGFFAVFS